MADNIADYLVRLRFEDEGVEGKLRAAVQQIIAQMRQLGQLPAGGMGDQIAQDIEKGLLSVAELAGRLEQLRALAATPVAGGGLGLDESGLAGLNQAVQKTQQLRLYLDEAAAANDRFNRSFGHLNQQQQDQIRSGLGAGLHVKDILSAMGIDPNTIPGYAGNKSGGAGDGEFRPDMLGIDRTARSGVLDARAEKDPLHRARLDYMAALDNETIVSQQKFKTETEANRAGEAAMARRQGAEDRLVDAIARRREQENKAATEQGKADERARTLGSQERKDLLERANIDPTDTGKISELRLRGLQIEQAALATARRDLVSKIEAAESMEELAKLRRQLETQERRELSNMANIRQEQFRSGGRGGFVGGLLGGHGGSPDGFNLQDIAFQAGQAAKYYALYRGLSALEQGFQEVIRTTQEYNQAVIDLSIAQGTGVAAAEKTADAFVKIGQDLGTGPAESVLAGAKFARTFRDDQGTPVPGAGDIGARVGSYINVLEGADRIEAVQQDLISIVRAYGQAAQDAPNIYDQATYIAQQYGYRTAGEVTGGVSAIADIGKESGYSIPQLISMIAGVMQSTGVSSDAAAGDIKRFLGSQETPEMNRLFTSLGVSLDQSFANRMNELASKLAGRPEAEQSRLLSSIGDARTAAAVVALVKNIQQANRISDRVESGAADNFADEKTRQQLNTFSGELRQLGVAVSNAALAVGRAGLVDFLILLARTARGAAEAIRYLADFVDSLPGPVQAAAQALVALLVTAQAVSLLNRISAGTGVVAGLAGSIRGIIAPTGQAVLSMAALRTGIVGLAGALGPAALALAAFAAVAVGIQSLSKVNQAKEGTAELQQASTDFEDAQRRGDVAAMQEARGRLLAARSKVAESADWLSDALANPGFGKSPQAEARDHLLDVADKRGEGTAQVLQDFARIQELDPTKSLLGMTAEELHQLRANMESPGRRIGLTAGTNADRLYEALPKPSDKAWDPFGGDFGHVSFGVDEIIQQGLSPERATEYLKRLLTEGGKSAAFNSTPGVKGATELAEFIKKQIGRSTNPLEQQADLQVLRDVTQQGLTEAKASGDTAWIESAAQLNEQTNKQFLEILISNGQAKIDALKSVNKDTPAARNQITAIVNSMLQEASASGDVSATTKVLESVDKAFLNAFRNNLRTYQQVLLQQLRTIQAAAAAGARAGGIIGAFKGLFDVGSQFAKIGDIGNQLKVLDEAEKQTNFSGGLNDGGDAFQWQDKKKGEDVELARLQSLGQPGNPVDQARAQLRVAQYQLNKADKGTVEYWNAVKAVNDAKYALAQAERQQAEAAASAGEIPGAPLSAARIAVANARSQLAGSVRGTADYYNALRSLREAQYQLAQIELEMANNRALLSIDITDPVAKARQQVVAARRKLSFDQNRGATQDVILQDQVSLREAESNAAGTAWSQRFGDMQTNYELNRISLSSYLNYLRSQHDYLSAVKDKTRQQVDELNQVDRALKGLTEGLNGQWNLGEIKVPTAYQMRAIVAGALPAGGGSTIQNTININGADLSRVMEMLRGLIGQGVYQTAGTAPVR